LDARVGEGLKGLWQPGILKSLVRCMSRFYVVIDGKAFSAFGLPYLMVAFSISKKGAVVSTKKFFQFLGVTDHIEFPMWLGAGKIKG
jgi:hypothetical protein